jgi:ribonuclease HI/exonuclease III
MMKIVSWNIRGLNGRSKQRILRECIMAEKPEVLLLQETKCRGAEVDTISQRIWRKCSSITTDSTGASGGLAILWNPDKVTISKAFTTVGTITAHFEVLGTNQAGAITNVYGPHSHQDKDKFMQSLELIKTLAATPKWILGGDFNMILTLEEKTGGLKRLEQDSGKFKALIDQLKLVDIENNNDTFTWSNRRSGNQHIACRLDRFLVTEDIMDSGSHLESLILPKAGSDHWPLALQMDLGEPPRYKPFRFEKFWLAHPDFQRLAKSWWEQAAIDQGSCMYRLQQRLKNFKQSLKYWNKNSFGNILQSIKDIENKLEGIQKTFISGARTVELMQEEEQLQIQLEERRKQEEILWKQKSRVQWLKEGEKNTKFFHRAMMHRRHINKITHLEDSQGNLTREHSKIEEELLKYYQDLLTEPQLDRTAAIRRVTKHIPALVTPEQNAALTRPITQEEVAQVVKDMSAGKAPGPDGFTVDFFHHCWDLVKKDVWEAVEESRASGLVLPALNATFLTLIPKEERVTNPKHFRPIALCNVIYKIITKTIAARLKPILPFLISSEQSGYVEGRQIMDSVILAHEIIHSLKSTGTPGMLIKLDLSKAFDRASWQYIRAVLSSFGFDQTWINWVLNLTSSAFFSILVNGVPSKPFSPTRGIRQGDPLSPFLFVLLAEGLGRYIKASIFEGSLKGLPLHNIQPAPSHSQFVDDTLLMNSPTVQEATKLNSILSDFSEASGMELNLDKSKLYFFNTPPPVQRHISRLLGIPRSSLPSNYLGVPLTGAAASHISWDSLLLSISNRLRNWTFRPLNIASRLVLLKSVLQALPTYLFTALAAPKKVIKAIRTLQRNFLWSGHQPNKKWALVNWDKLCMPKNQGGLGLRDPGKMNQTMGAKIWWRWLKNPTAAWAQLWKRKYAPHTPEDQLIRHNNHIQGSNVWNTAWLNRTVVQQHAFWELREGGSALFWTDSWQQLRPLETIDELAALKRTLHQHALPKVKELWVSQPPQQRWRQWKTSHQELGIPETLDLRSWHSQATKRKILCRNGPDILRWGHTTTGTFTIKEAYSLQANQQNPGKEPIWNKVWSSALWPKISTFLWLLVHNRALTWDNLRKRGFNGPSMCVLCSLQEESKEHLFNSCHYSQQIWDYGAQIMRKSNRNRSSINCTIEKWDSISFNNPILNLIWNLLPGFTLWQIWKERNQRIFRSQSSLPEVIWTKVRAQISETVRSKSWSEIDWQCNNAEKPVLQNWQSSLRNHLTARCHKRQPTSPNTWTPPPTHYIKINFDGASRGNPGSAGYGAVIRDSCGAILSLDAGYIGETTNNVAELTGLLRGLQSAIDTGHQRIILEGDSQIIIRLITRILHGCTPEKISPSWRLHGLLADFSQHLQPHLTITTSHVKREANKVADRLANEAVEQGKEHLRWERQSSPDNELLNCCQALANRDLHSPDGVIREEMEPRGQSQDAALKHPPARPAPHICPT